MAERSTQERRLRELVGVLQGADGVQGRRLVGVDAHEVTLDRLHELPTVCKQDLWDAYPFGFQVSSDIVCVHGSSGTGGRPTLIPYTAHDVDVWAEVMARALEGAGATKNSLIHNAYGYGLFTGGLGVHHGGMRLGATVLPVSGGMTERQVRLIADLKPDVLCCTPSYALHLADALDAAGVEPTFRTGVFGAEPWTEAMRTEIERRLRLKALDIYGLSEIIGPGVACESLDSGGLLNVADDHFYVEALDDDGKPVPDGTPGELTFTTLTKTGMPLLRYRTGDIASLHHGRMSKLKGRKDDMLVVRGVNVFPTEIEAVLLDDPRVTPHYLVVEDRRDPSRPELRVVVESAHDVAAGITAKLKERLGITTRVHVLEPGQVPRAETGKARRLVRWTGGEPPLPQLT